MALMTCTMDWLQKKIWPAEDKLDGDVAHAQTMPASPK